MKGNNVGKLKETLRDVVDLRYVVMVEEIEKVQR